MNRSIAALLVAILLAPLGIAALAQVDLSQTVVLRVASDSNADGALDTLSSPPTGTTLSFIAPNHAQVDDSANAADGNIAVLDLSLVPEASGPVVVRAIDTNAAGLTFKIGDLATNIATDFAVVYMSSQGIRVWVPGNNYITVQQALVIPSADGAVYEVVVEPYEELGAPTQPGAQEPDFIIQGDTSTGPIKQEITLNKGDKVLVKVASDAGKHDVYIFTPSNPNYSTVKNSTSTSWTFYNSKADFKIWYPAKSKSFTAPESGTYLFVIVPFSTAGQVTVEVYIDAGQADETPIPLPTPPEEDDPSFELPNMGSNIAVAIVAIAVAGVVALLLTRR